MITAPTQNRADFWLFFVGQTISTLGSAITIFAMPLLVYQLTGSALNLALTTAFGFLPYLLLGLPLGAWVDRLDRKRLMVGVAFVEGLLMSSIPLLYTFATLPLWWIYLVVFVAGALHMTFQAAEFAVIPSLAGKDDLVTANGRIQASYSAAQIAGPLLAGVLLIQIDLPLLFFLDALTFIVAALLIAQIKRPLIAEAREPSSVLADIRTGLAYVWQHPVLRNISIMMALVNLVFVTVTTQLVLFANVRFEAGESEIGIFYAAGSAGVVLLSLLAAPLRRRFGFSRVALGALMLSGLCLIALSLTTWYWLAVVLWALQMGLGILFNINTGSLRQSIVPSHLLGRVMSVAMVLAWSAMPLGSLLGGIAIERSGNVALIYGIIGILTTIIPLVFAFTPLGHAERYLPQAATPVTP